MLLKTSAESNRLSPLASQHSMSPQARVVTTAPGLELLQLQN